MVVGEDRVALSGSLDAIGRHRHAAPAVVVGLDAPLAFVSAAGGHRSRAALLAPGFHHAVDTRGGRIAVFLLPSDALAVGGLSGSIADLSRVSAWVELGEAVACGGLTTFDPVDALLAREGRAAAGLRPIHERLRAALDVLRARLDENLSVEELASCAGLSPAHLMTLAREQLGAPLRAHRRWLRTFRVARDYARGATLTEAAHAAGFASSSHLSTAARAHFGIRPSDVLAPSRRPLIHAP